MKGSNPIFWSGLTYFTTTLFIFVEAFQHRDTNIYVMNVYIDMHYYHLIFLSGKTTAKIYSQLYIYNIFTQSIFHTMHDSCIDFISEYKKLSDTKCIILSTMMLLSI